MYDPVKHDPVIKAAAERHGISPNILWGVMQQESGGRPRPGPTTDNSGRPLSARADGYFQFMPETATRYGVVRGNFESEAEGAARYLSDLKRVKGDMWGALSAYGGYVKADPDPYISGIMERAARSPFNVRPSGDPTEDLDAQILAKIEQRKPQQSPNPTTPAAVINPDAKRSPLGRRASELKDEEILEAVGFLPGLVAGVVGGAAGSAAGIPLGPAGIVAGGAIGSGAAVGAATYWKIKDRFPDIDDERAKRLAAREGVIDAGLSAGFGVAAKGLGAAKAAGAFTPVEEYLRRISGKVPRSASRVGVAALDEYQKAATTMSRAIDEQLVRLRSDLGSTEEVGKVFNEARKGAAQEVRTVIERQFAPMKVGTAAGNQLVPVRNVEVDQALKAYQDITKSSPTLISPKVQALLDEFTPGGARVKEAQVHRLIGFRREIDNLIDWDESADVSRDVAERVLRPLRNALNQSVTDGLATRGFPIEAGLYGRANKTYSEMQRLLNNEFIVKLADKDPDAMIRFAGSKAGTTGFEDVEKAVDFIVKSNPKYKPADGVKFLDGIRNEYTKTMLSSNAKMVELANVLADPKVDPGMYRAFESLFKNNLSAKKAVEDAVRAAKAVTDFADEVNMKAGRGGLGQGGVTAAVSTAGMVGGSPAVAGTAGALALITGPIARATARAATEGNKDVLQKSRWVSNYFRNAMATAGAAGFSATDIPERIQNFITELQLYGDTDGRNAQPR